MNLLFNNWDEHLYTFEKSLKSLEEMLIKHLSLNQKPHLHINPGINLKINLLTQQCIEYGAILQFEQSWLTRYKTALENHKEYSVIDSFIQKYMKDVDDNIKSINNTQERYDRIKTKIEMLVGEQASKIEENFFPTEGAFSLNLVNFHILLTTVRITNNNDEPISVETLNVISEKLLTIKRENKRAEDIKCVIRSIRTHLSKTMLENILAPTTFKAIMSELKNYTKKLDEFEIYNMRLKQYANNVMRNQHPAQKMLKTFPDHHKLPHSTQEGVKIAETFKTQVKNILGNAEKTIKQSPKPDVMSTEVFDRHFSTILKNIETKKAEQLYLQIQTSIRSFNRMKYKPETITTAIKQPLIEACKTFRTSYNAGSHAVKTPDDNIENIATTNNIT